MGVRAGPWARLSGKVLLLLPRLNPGARQSMLQKVAIHQTRLRVPGVGVDARGVCMGARGLVLLQTLDRLVAFLAIYTREVALTHVIASMKIQQVRSELGAREIALSFEAVSSDVMDRMAQVSRLTGAFTFTGTSRHFVQYRDASAPFGYDAAELLSNNAELCLYHNTFSQAYAVERQPELRQLVLRLAVLPDATSPTDTGAAWLLAEPALGAPLVRHLAQASVAARAARVNAGSTMAERGRDRWLFHLERVPSRIFGLVTRTPGLELFFEKTPGAAVEHGHAHPLALGACPVFERNELVLFRGGRRQALVVPSPPILAPVSTLVLPKVMELDAVSLTSAAEPPTSVSTAVRLMPSASSTRQIGAARLRGNEPEQLRRLAYVLGARTLAETRLAATDQGVFVLQAADAPQIPLGDLYARAGERLFVPLGYELLPRLEPRLLLESMGVPEHHLLFFHVDGSCHALAERTLVSLAHALVEPSLWAEVPARQFAPVLDAELPVLWLDSLGLRPLKKAGEAP